MLTVRGLGTVLGDLATMGYDAKWGVFSAKSIGAPIERERLFIACTNEESWKKGMGHKQDRQGEIFKPSNKKCPEFWLQAPPIDSGMVNGVADYMESVGAIGNGQVPAVVKTAWDILSI
jgi:DNA (cytosine-5)-methyltransferase 1